MSRLLAQQLAQIIALAGGPDILLSGVTRPARSTPNGGIRSGAAQAKRAARRRRNIAKHPRGAR